MDLVSWIDNNGLKGWDPYDIRGSKISLKIQKCLLSYLAHGNCLTVGNWPDCLRRE